jgi:site-specific DNA-methyltransferase (adenine-specific)/modification methylase
MRVETIGRATLFNADCADVLSQWPECFGVSAVVTDPPYGIKESAGKAKTRGKLAKAKDYGNDDWDNQPIDTDLLQRLIGLGRWQIVFGGNYYPMPAASCWLVWDKVNGNNDFADCELAWTNLRRAVRLKRYMWNGMLREKGAQRGDHPTQKPLEVMKWCIEQLPDDVETILDPFAGSGTTGVAAIQMGKRFIGIEREPKYFEAMCRRIREANGDDAGPLFGEAA